MADTKISALTSATTPLAGTEVLPIVQSSTTKQVSVANLTLGRAVNTAGGTFTNNLIQGTAAKGVNFTANTAAAGMTSQLLNWYEEGTWTPTYLGSTGNPTIVYDTQQGTYTRVGRLVTCSFSINTTTATGGSGLLQLGGLPFPVVSNGYADGVNGSGAAYYAAGWIVNYPTIVGANTGASNCYLRTSATGSYITPADLNPVAGNALRCTFSYIV
jgi:hypothetical protein